MFHFFFEWKHLEMIFYLFIRFIYVIVFFFSFHSLSFILAFINAIGMESFRMGSFAFVAGLFFFTCLVGCLLGVEVLRVWDLLHNL